MNCANLRILGFRLGLPPSQGAFNIEPSIFNPPSDFSLLTVAINAVCSLFLNHGMREIH